MTSNIDKPRADAIKIAASLGTQAGAGAVALTDLAIAFADYVRQGLFSTGEAEGFYCAYATAYNKRIAADGRGHDVIPAEKDGAKVSISILKTFGLPAVTAAGADWFTRIAAVRSTIASDNRFSVYNSMVRANRAIAAAGKADKLTTPTEFANCAAKVTDEQIEAWIVKTPKDAKSADDKLRELVAKLGKLAEDPSFIARGIGTQLLEYADKLSAITGAKVELVKAA